jgi:hypothetical protein
LDQTEDGRGDEAREASDRLIGALLGQDGGFVHKIQDQGRTYAEPSSPSVRRCAIHSWAVRDTIADMSRGAALFLAFGTLMAQPLPPARVLFGDSEHPVAFGEVWLIAHQWGRYPGVLVARIQNGTLEQVSEWSSKMAGWDFAFEYKLLVAVSDRLVPPRELRTTDEVYDMFKLEFVREFAYLYLSDPLGSAQHGEDWPAALSRMGVTTNGRTLTLPRPGRRTIRLLYPDARPLAGKSIAVSLFGTRSNHCGHPAGVPVGTFRTDSGGRISFTTTPGPLALAATSYFEEESAGPAGVRFVLQGSVVTGPEVDVTLRKWWEPPTRAYVLALRTGAGQPLIGAHLLGCYCNNVCGAVCGPIPVGGAGSDHLGFLRFKFFDLRSMEKIRVVNAAGEEKALSESDLRQLMTTLQLTFTWR